MIIMTLALNHDLTGLSLKIQNDVSCQALLTM